MFAYLYIYTKHIYVLLAAMWNRLIQPSMQGYMYRYNRTMAIWTPTDF